MSDLVALVDIKAFLEVTGSDDDSLLTDLLEHAEALFEAQCGRESLPFVAAASARTEVQDGTGSPNLYLEYPITTVTTIKIGWDTSDPIETLDPTDVAKVVWGAGSRKVRRTDGGRFGAVDKPRFVHITYDAAADLPEDANLAVKRVVAQIYRQRGSEDAKQERDGGFSHTLATVATEDPVWTMAVANHTRGVLV